MLRTFKIEFTGDGEARITVPGASSNADSQALASFTEQLAKALGTVTERHIGEYRNGLHVHADGTTHAHHEHEQAGGGA